MKSNYDNQQSGLKRQPSELTCQGDGFPSTAVETPAITVEDDETVSERSMSSVVKFADVLLQVAKRQDGWNSLQLVYLLTDRTFKMTISKRYMRSLKDCTYVSTRNTRRPMSNNGFSRIFAKGINVKKDGCGTLRVKDVSIVLRKQFAFCRKDDNMFHPE